MLERILTIVADTQVGMCALGNRLDSFQSEFGAFRAAFGTLQGEVGELRIDRLQDRITLQREEDDVKIDLAERAGRTPRGSPKRGMTC